GPAWRLGGAVVSRHGLPAGVLSAGCPLSSVFSVAGAGTIPHRAWRTDRATGGDRDHASAVKNCGAADLQRRRELVHTVTGVFLTRVLPSAKLRGVDPLRYSIRLSDGQEFGPASIDLVAQWAREGRVPPD